MNRAKRIEFRLSEQEYESYERAARAADRKLSDWIRAALNDLLSAKEGAKPTLTKQQLEEELTAKQAFDQRLHPPSLRGNAFPRVALTEDPVEDSSIEREVDPRTGRPL